MVGARHQHHAELVTQLDGFRRLADEIHDLGPQAVVSRLAAELAFVREQLLPHMEMAERTLYPELERLLEDPQAMEPMRREHAEAHRLLSEVSAFADRLTGPVIILRDELAMRRILYRLFSLMRVHLHEEEHYLEIIEHHEPASQAESLRHAMQRA